MTDAQQKERILDAVDNDAVITVAIDWLYDNRLNLDDADPSGDLRYNAVLIDALDIMLGPAAKDVDVSDGGGQSGQYSQYFDHLEKLRQEARAEYARLYKAAFAAVGIQIVSIATNSLLPVYPGYVDPTSPSLLGDPRYLPGDVLRRNS